MTEIYLIRHVQAEGNLYRVMQGHFDGAVTALGLRQVEALAERFRDVKLDALYSSDLHRARVTASAIERTHALTLRTDPRLREINVGPWERRFFGDLLYEEPALIGTFLQQPTAWRLDGAETYADVTARACAAMERTCGRYGSAERPSRSSSNTVGPSIYSLTMRSAASSTASSAGTRMPASRW